MRIATITPERPFASWVNGSGVVLFAGDGDTPCPEAFADVDWSKTATARGSIIAPEGQEARECFTMKDVCLHKGGEAIVNYIGANAKASGTAYNLDLIPPDALERYHAHAPRNTAYPHLQLDVLAAAYGDVVLTTAASAIEGPPLDNAIVPSAYDDTYSFGSRMDQHLGLRDALFDAVRVSETPDDVEMMAAAYVRLCARTLRMVTHVNRRQYERARCDATGYGIAAANKCIADIRDFAWLAPMRDWMVEQINAMVRPPTAE